MRNVRPFEAPFRKRPAKAKSGHSCIHESAVKHVTGTAYYIDDIPSPAGTLHLASGRSIHAHAKITSLKLDTVRSSEGVVSVFTHEDVPGKLDVGAVYPGDPLLAPGYVEFVGQPIFVVAATSYKLAQQAVCKAEVEYEVLAPVFDVKEALKKEFFVLPTHTIQRGNPDKILQDSSNVLTSESYIRGQEHMYLEGQVCLVTPTEDGGMHVQVSSQHPTEVQKLVAEVLDIPVHLVTTEVRRMGGGFGGKESQAAALACMAAMVASVTGAPAKFRLPRRQDMEATGKRHDFHSRAEVAFDHRGVIDAMSMTLSGMCGYSPDLSQGIIDRAIFHADNAYYLSNAKIIGHCCKTHTVSNTAFRGFGGPQGMLAMENVIERIARQLGKDPLIIRQNNLYRPGYDITPYSQKICGVCRPANFCGGGNKL
jgi:xanthine dehydrogenase large subunit